MRGKFFFILLSLVFTAGPSLLYWYNAHRPVIPTHDDNVVVGHPHVRDGDSIVLKNVEMRLLGIDAPELAQNCGVDSATYPCGYEAKNHLKTLIGNKIVECHWAKTDIYHRALAMCYVDKSTCLNRQMVLDGWAVNFYLFPQEEKIAKKEKRGIWRSPFEIPKLWRREHHKSFTRVPHLHQPFMHRIIRQSIRQLSHHSGYSR